MIGLAIYTPNQRQQIKLAESVGPNATNYQRVANRGIVLSLLLNALVLVVIFLMVAKPVLWAA